MVDNLLEEYKKEYEENKCDVISNHGQRIDKKTDCLIY